MTTVLVAGATGTLGSRIAHHLARQPDVGLRLLVRPGWDTHPDKKERVAPLVAAGAETVVGDVTDPDSLTEATHGVDTVVSALQGQREVIVDGQVALARAAVADGVRRFIPSDFAIDLFNAPEGAPQFEIRKEADRIIDELPMDVLHVLNGAFMDMMFNPAFPGIVDVDNGVVRFWGTGHEPFDAATVEDTARFTARLATDPTVGPGVYGVSGGPVTHRQIVRVLSEVTGQRVEPHPLGDEAELRSRIEARANPWDSLYDWYSLAMLSTPPLTEPDNERYDDAQPTTVADYLRSAYGERTA